MLHIAPGLAVFTLAIILGACQPTWEEQEQFLRDYYVERQAELEPSRLLMDEYWARANELRVDDLAQPLVIGDRPSIIAEYGNTALVFDGKHWSSNVHNGQIDTPVHRLERGGLLSRQKKMDYVRRDAENWATEHLETRYLAVVKVLDRADASVTEDFEMEGGRISAIGIQGGIAQVTVLVFDLRDERFLGSKLLEIEVAPGTELRAVDIQGSLEQALSRTIVERATAALRYHSDLEPEPPADEVEPEVPAEQ
jgi:hypothetical protein